MLASDYILYQFLWAFCEGLMATFLLVSVGEYQIRSHFVFKQVGGVTFCT